MSGYPRCRQTEETVFMSLNHTLQLTTWNICEGVTGTTLQWKAGDLLQMVRGYYICKSGLLLDVLWYKQVWSSIVVTISARSWLQDSLGNVLSGFLSLSIIYQPVCNHGNHSNLKTTNLLLQWKSPEYCMVCEVCEGFLFCANFFLQDKSHSQKTVPTSTVNESIDNIPVWISIHCGTLQTI